MNFTLPPGGSKARNEPSGRGAGGSIRVPTALPGNSLTLVSDPPEGRVKSLHYLHLFFVQKADTQESRRQHARHIWQLPLEGGSPEVDEL